MAPLWLYTTDRSLRYTWIYQPLPGFTAAQMLGKRIDELLPPAPAADLLALHQEALAQAASQQQEVSLQFGETTHCYDLTVEPLRDAQGEISGLKGTAVEISAQKRAEAALAEAETKYHLLFEAIADAIFIAGPDGVYLDVNPAAAAMLGRTRQELIGAHYSMVIPPEWLETGRKVGQSLRATGRWAGEFPMRRADGVVIWTEYRSYWDGQRVVGVAREVTERKQAEAALRASEERLRLAVEATGLGIWEMYPDRDEIVWSPQCKQIHGLPADAQITRQQVRETIYPADLEALQSAMDAFYAPPRNRSLDTEHRIVRSDGAVRWIRVQGRFLDEAGNGQLPQRSLGTMLDITEQKRGEEEIAASRRFLARVAQAIPDSLMVYDLPEQRIIYHNPALAKILGLHDEQSLAQTQPEIDSRIHPDDRERVQKEFARLYQAADDEVVEIAFRFQTAGGEYCWLQERTVVFARDAAGAVTQHLSVSRDISERKAAEEDLRFLAELAERIRLAGSAGGLVQEVAQALGEYLQVGRCLFIEVDPAAGRGRVAGQHCRGLPPAPDEFALAGYNPETLAELAAGRTLVNQDAKVDPHTADRYDTVYAPVRERAYIGAPLLAGGQWRGILAVTSAEPRAWQRREVSLLETVAERTWLAVEKLQLAAELRASEEDLRTITDAVPGLIAYVDAEERYQFVNAMYERWFGRPRREILGRRIADLAGEGYRRIQPHIARVMAGRAVTFEVDFPYPDGHKTVLVTYRPHLGENGVLGFYVLVTDITERKAAEERLRFLTEATAALTSSLDYAATLQRVADLMAPALADWCTVDMLQADGTLELVAVAHKDPAKVAWARELRRRFPPDMNETQGLPNVLRTGRAEFYPDIPLEQMWEAAETEEQRQILVQLPFKSLIIAPLRVRDQTLGAIQLLWSDSDRRYTEADLHFVEELAQRAALAVDNARLYQEARSAAIQLSELNARLEERIAERTAELEHSNRELDQFAHVASHDLKAPLRGIEQLARFLQQDVYALLPERSQRHLDLLLGRAKRMETLLDDLLAYARAVRQRYAPQPLDLPALIHETVELLAPPPGFVVEIVEPMPALTGERVPLGTVLRNLIGNAIKHHHQPAQGRVRITAVARGDRVEITVTDNGPGIDPGYHERIFEIFQTLQPRSQVDGSGVGLAVVKKTIELRGGGITVASSPGDGARFQFTWPQGSTSIPHDRPHPRPPQ